MFYLCTGLLHFTMKYPYKDTAFYLVVLTTSTVFAVLVGLIYGCVPAEGNHRTAYFEHYMANDSIPTLVRVDSMGLYIQSDSFIPLTRLVSDSERLVYVFCHAEEDSLGLNPGLSERGALRARVLSGIFADAAVGAILTPPFRRTYLSARPLAESHGVDPILFEPEDAGSFLRLLSRAPAPLVIITTSDHLDELRAFFRLPTLAQNCYDIGYALAIDRNLEVRDVFVFRYGPTIVVH